MEIILAAVRASGVAKSELSRVAAEYVQRCLRFYPARSVLLKSVDAVFELKGRGAAFLVLMDSRGQALSSEELAGVVERVRDGGKRTLIFAIGPADGWSDEDRRKADLLISLGKMTLPHELAAVVLAEQVYRACTILAGHPYHCGH